MPARLPRLAAALLGLALLLAALLAYPLGLDHNPEWGRSRTTLVAAGLACLLLAAWNPHRHATLTHALTDLWVLAEICGGHFATLPHGLLGPAAEAHLWPLVTALKKVGLALSEQLFKKASVTAHLPVGYKAVRLAKA